MIGPGRFPDKPVVHDQRGRFVKGSGRPLAANDPVAVGKTTGYLRSKSYADALEALIPVDAEGPDTAVTSLVELVAAAKKLAVPENKAVEFECTACHHANRVIVEAKPDQKMLSFLIERLAGAAQKTMQVNTHSEEVVRLMSDSRVLHSVEFIALTPEEKAERARKVIEA